MTFIACHAVHTVRRLISAVGSASCRLTAAYLVLLGIMLASGPRQADGMPLPRRPSANALHPSSVRTSVPVAFAATARGRHFSCEFAGYFDYGDWVDYDSDSGLFYDWDSGYYFTDDPYDTCGPVDAMDNGYLTSIGYDDAVDYAMFADLFYALDSSYSGEWSNDSNTQSTDPPLPSCGSGYRPARLRQVSTQQIVVQWCDPIDNPPAPPDVPAGDNWAAWGDVMGLFFNWWNNTGPTSQTFGQGTIELTQMRQAKGVVDARSSYLYKYGAPISRSDCAALKPAAYRVGFGWQGAASSGTNATQQFVGSYLVYITPYNGGQDLQYDVYNVTSMRSFLYDVGGVPLYNRGTFVGGWEIETPSGPFWLPPVELPGGNMAETFEWTETGVCRQV